MAKSRKTEDQPKEAQIKQSAGLLKYKPVPRFGGGCKNC
jgi:hypothetical protein